MLKSILPIATSKKSAICAKSFEEKAINLRRGATFDIKKCISDGKPLIIEGTYLLDSLYIQEGLTVKTVGDGALHPEASAA